MRSNEEILCTYVDSSTLLAFFGLESLSRWLSSHDLPCVHGEHHGEHCNVGDDDLRVNSQNVNSNKNGCEDGGLHIDDEIVDSYKNDSIDMDHHGQHGLDNHGRTTRSNDVAK